MQLLSAAKSRATQVILISDGISDPADSISVAVALRQAGAKLSVIGIGVERESQLRELARSGGGVYQSLGSRGAHSVLNVEAAADFSHQPGREINVDSWVEKGVWLLLPLLLLAALGYRRGWLAVLVVVLGQQPQEAMAVSWDDLWLTPRQQAKRLLDKGQPGQAAELFEDPNWRGAAHFQSGEFGKAAAQFSDSDAAYNRANALAKAGKLSEALKSYDEALTKRPDDDDARFNRELVQKLLDQQQQRQEQKQEQKQEQQQQEQQQQEQQQDSSAQSSQDGESDKKQEQRDQESAQSAAKQQRPRADDGEQERAGAQSQDAPSNAEKRESERREDEQQKATDDVAPQSAKASATQQRTPVDEAADKAPQNKPENTQAKLDETPTTEQELALQQWLRQVPDDPGGLLRRKFMLEHLQRQKERKVP